MPRTATTSQAGFTLIELLIAVSIVAILAAIALPSYQNSIKKARRADAQGVLVSFANVMERRFTANSTYVGLADADGVPLPAVFPSEAPLDGATKYYNLTINAATATTYTLRAAPKGAQAGDGILELDHTGARRWDRDNSGAFAAAENCWDC